jgi:predicted nucleotidyltransferase component of viral defense system
MLVLNQISNLAAVEQFHLLFLAQLGTRLNKRHYVLKGGCNLRFFWRSIRYSEDIDFDVHVVAKQTLQKNVNQILTEVGFGRILASSRIDISSIAEAKQTDTTQRWKIHLRIGESSADLPTRIEFARRKFGDGVIFESIDSEIVQTYKIRPILASHYGLESAFEQKVGALIGRGQPQARDIFDLAYLKERGATGSSVERTRRRDLRTACENAMSVSFDEFKGQIVAYMLPHYQEFYGKREMWNQLQQNVVKTLENL